MWVPAPPQNLTVIALATLDVEEAKASLALNILNYNNDVKYNDDERTERVALALAFFIVRSRITDADEYSEVTAVMTLPRFTRSGGPQYVIQIPNMLKIALLTLGENIAVNDAAGTIHLRPSEFVDVKSKDKELKGKSDEALWADFLLPPDIPDAHDDLREQIDVKLSFMGLETEDLNRKKSKNLGMATKKANANLRLIFGGTTVKWSEAWRVRRFKTELGAIVETRINPDLVREMGLCPSCYKTGVLLPGGKLQQLCYCTLKEADDRGKPKRVRGNKQAALAALVATQAALNA